MEIILFNRILNWLLGLIGIGLILFVSYLIGLLGKQIKKGFTILKYINNDEKILKAKGNSTNAEKIILRKKAKRKIIYPIVGIIVFYIIAFIFIPTLELKLLSLLFLVPVFLGFFGVFIVPDFD